MGNRPCDKGPDSSDKVLSSKGCISATWNSISVEPAGFLYVFNATISGLVLQNVLMQTICQADLGYPADNCTEIINNVNATNKHEEEEIQSVWTGVQAVTSVVCISITMLVVLFFGSWSEVNGRRVPLILSLSGATSLPVLILLAHFLMGKLSAMQASLLIMIPSSVAGGGVVFAMSAYAYISDTTTTENRTVRTGMLSAAKSAGAPLGFAMGGLLSRFGIGVVPILIFATSIALLALLIIILTVKSVKPLQKDQDSSNHEPRAWIRYNPLTKLIQLLAMLFKKRENRHSFWLLILCQICYIAPAQGENSLMYLFLREKLSWGISDYGFFSTAHSLLSSMGVVLSTFIFSKVLSISDPVIGFIGGLSQVGGDTLFAFAYTTPMVYGASVIRMMSGALIVIIRSMLSKTVQPDEVGQTFALLGIIESLVPLVMAPVYAITYHSTVFVFPGAFFFMSAGIMLPAEVIFLYFSCKRKQDVTNSPMEGSHNSIKTAAITELDLANSIIKI